MKAVAFALALFIGQAITMQDKPVVHLKAPHGDIIQAAFGGSRVELSQAPPVIYLPVQPPKPGADGNPWTVDVKNFGPAPVTVVDKGPFSAQVSVNQTIHIYSNGSIYILKH
jgi:hypothetical protein